MAATSGETGSGDRRDRWSSVPRAVAATVVVLILLAGGGALWWDRWGPGRPQGVVIVGDSITFLSTPVLQTVVPDGPVVTGVPGARADQRLGDAKALAAVPRDQVVINLGTNDVLQNWPRDQTLASLEQIGQAFDRARCVDLVTINEQMFSFDDAGLSDRAVRLNQGLRDLAARHGWHIIDWNRIVVDYMASGSPEGPITSDTVHPTEPGKQLLARATADAVASC